MSSIKSRSASPAEVDVDAIFESITTLDFSPKATVWQKGQFPKTQWLPASIRKQLVKLVQEKTHHRLVLWHNGSMDLGVHTQGKILEGLVADPKKADGVKCTPFQGESVYSHFPTSLSANLIL